MWFGDATGGVADGVNINPGASARVDGINFTDVDFFNQFAGITTAAATGTVRNINIVNSRFAGLGQIGANLVNVSHCNLSDNQIGSVAGFGTVGTAIALSGSTDFCNISHNDVQQSTTKITSSASGTHNRTESNIGFNPVGNVTPTVGASPWTYTASTNRETAYVFGGTISQILINGTLLIGSAAGPWIIPLEPNDTMTIIYTVAPVVNVQRH
jgi:hypothetical protein